MFQALIPLASSVLGGMGGGGGAASAPPPPPINNTANFGAVSFGNKFLGDSAVKEAATVESVAAGGVARWLPWAVGGVVALILGVLLIRRPRGRK